MTAFPEHGRAFDEIAIELEQRRARDVRWREGRVFSLVYHAGDDVYAVAQEAYARYSAENGLNTGAFPSLGGLQADLVGWVAELAGLPLAPGFVTTGGTESLLMAVLAARERGRAERGVERPDMVLPASAHGAFEKAAHYFGVRSIRVPVGPDWRADVDAMRAAVSRDTVLIVASAPQYPQGVIDPVAPIAAIAANHDINCHVDACMGGITLPFLAEAGEPIAPWDFRVEGVTSLSVDLHKFGYTAKGASVILYRNKELRRHQTFVTDNWLGGLYGSSGVLGTKSGGALAAAWAVMQYLGRDGYRRLTARARDAALRLADGIEATPPLTLRARPDSMLLAFGSDRLDIFAVGDALAERGWYVDRQGPPSSLHCTVNAVHAPMIDDFLTDLRRCVGTVGASTSDNRGVYGTVE